MRSLSNDLRTSENELVNVLYYGNGLTIEQIAAELEIMECEVNSYLFKEEK